MKKLILEAPNGALDEQYFKNISPDVQGDILAVGTSHPGRLNNWWEMRELWGYPYYKLSIILPEGAGYFRNETGYESELGYGSFFLTFPGVKHQYNTGQGELWNEFRVCFVGKIFDGYRASGVLSPARPVWKLDQPAPFIRRLQRLFRGPQPVDDISIARQSVAFLNVLLSMMEKATPVENNPAQSDVFTRACRLLTRDMHNKIDYHEVARELGMSYHTFRLYFTRRAGMPPSRYREKQRIANACHILLNNPSKSSERIAFVLGYSRSDHFSAQFKRHIGMTPREYQARHLKSGQPKSQPRRNSL